MRAPILLTDAAGDGLTAAAVEKIVALALRDAEFMILSGEREVTPNIGRLFTAGETVIYTAVRNAAIERS